MVEGEVTWTEGRGDEKGERRSGVARENGGVNEMIETRWSERTRDRCRFVAKGGSNRREKTIYTSEKEYISLECRREERAGARGEEGVRSTSER